MVCDPSIPSVLTLTGTIFDLPKPANPPLCGVPAIFCEARIFPVLEPTLTSINPPLPDTVIVNRIESTLVISTFLYNVQSPSLMPRTEEKPNLAEVIKPLAEASNFVASYSLTCLLYTSPSPRDGL